ncbi:MAG: hypothetical protein AAFX79_11895 [Planctomycetota bacterium]
MGTTNAKKRLIVSLGLAVLGVAMIAIGGIAVLVPPILTGIGFLLLAWYHGTS